MTERNRILRMETQNVMRLKAVEITPDGNIVIIGGKNAQGKTSVLTAIQMALGGTKEVPERPIRDGQSNAYVVIETKDFTVTRKFTAAGGSTLEIRNPEGQKLGSPQTLLDSFVSKVTFDPLAFTRMDDAKQMETVRKLAALDFTELDAKRKAKYDERTLNNRQVTTQQAKVQGLKRYPEAPQKEIVITELTAKLEEATQKNKTREEKAEQLSTANDNLDVLTGNIESLETRIADLQKELAGYKTQKEEQTAARDTLRAELDAMEEVDTAPIIEEMNTADATNAQVRANKEFTEANRELLRLQGVSETLTQEIDAIDKEKEKALSEVQFPIDGLSFSDSGVLFNKIPLKQASGAEQLRVSLAIATALNPKLPVMLIRDGSLLDEDSLKLVAEHADKHGAQVWIEMVGDREDATVIIEDGSSVEPTAKTKKK